jgi:chorismate mutase
MPELPIFCDPSHIAGNRDCIALLCQQAMDLQFDGLIIETHCHPDAAWSDAAQQITPEMLAHLLSRLVVRDADRPSQFFSELRWQIDQIDEGILELLARRMQVSAEMGEYKRKNSMPALQTIRYSEIIEHRTEYGKTLDLDPEFIRDVIREIHEESVRKQMDVMNQD